MPGYSIVFNRKGRMADYELQYRSALAESIVLPFHTPSIVVSDKYFFIASTSYEHYPLFHFSNETFDIYVEGFIFDPQIEGFLKEICPILDGFFENKTGSADRLAALLQTIDGDFNVTAFQKRSGKCIIFNDLLGHLPLYYTINNEYCAVSREISFLHHVMKDCTLDKKAAAQYLLFCFPLQSRTLIENISKLSPGTIMSMDPASGEVTIRRIHQFNYEEMEEKGRTKKDAVENLIDLWSKVIQRRVSVSEQQKNILALSGGLDSRSVAAGLYKNGIPFSALSFAANDGSSEKDVSVARQVAETLRVPLHVEKLPQTTGENSLKLLRMKYGLNYLGMAYTLTFYDVIRNMYGNNVMYFSGDTGMVMRDYRPTANLHNFDTVLRYMFSYGGRFSSFALLSLNEVREITGIQKEDIFEDIYNEFMTYPEQSLCMKYIHFTFDGYCSKWHYEGIDRIRNYFWPAVPFESLPFFMYAMACKQEHKKNYRLFRDFISTLSPETIPFINVNWNLPIDSPLIDLKSVAHKFYLKTPYTLRTLLKKQPAAIKQYPENNPLYLKIRKQLEQEDIYAKYFNPSFLRKNITEFNRPRLNTILTLLSLVDLVHH